MRVVLCNYLEDNQTATPVVNKLDIQSSRFTAIQNISQIKKNYTIYPISRDIKIPYDNKARLVTQILWYIKPEIGYVVVSAFSEHLFTAISCTTCFGRSQFPSLCNTTATNWLTHFDIISIQFLT